MKTIRHPSIEKLQLDYDDQVEIRYAKMVDSDGLNEYHIMLQPAQLVGRFEEQLEALNEAYKHALSHLGIEGDSAIIRRFFCSDPANQKPILEAHPIADIEAPCVISLIGQAPLPHGKIALWAYHVDTQAGPLSKKRMGNTLELKREILNHYWTTNCASSESEHSADQTQNIFDNYNAFLNQHDLNLADHVVRTWLYVRDVDSNYQGLVDARRELFIQHGLNPQTHYIASTGIEGTSSQAAEKVSMDAYAIAGLKPEQVQYLQAPQHIGPTHLYGVSFERATAISFRDRKHVYISGTASIDPEGSIVHPGNALKQLDRALENMDALLQDADGSLDSIVQYIVYLRDSDDAQQVQQIFEQRFPSTPRVITKGSVCRPGWLIEVEAIAIIAHQNPALPSF